MTDGVWGSGANRDSTRWRQVVHAVNWILLAGFLFSVHNKSATALTNLGLYLPLIIWVARWRFANRPIPYLRDPLLWLALALVVLVELSCLWSPDPLASIDQFRREFAVIAIVAITLAHAGSDRRTLRRWCLVLVVAVAWRTGQQIRDWAISAVADGHLLPTYGQLRDYGYGIVFALPFLFVVSEWSGPRVRMLLKALLALLAMLAVATGSRGTWFAFTAVLFAGGLLFHARRTAFAIAALGLVAALFFAWMEPANTITTNIGRGIDSSYRRMGAWIPAANMIAEKPLHGFGFGKFVFDDEYNGRKPSHPEWELERSMGPHSLFFEVGFAAGLGALLIYITLCAAFVGRAWRLATSGEPWRQVIARGVLLSFLGQYLVYGFIESMSWYPLAVHLGLLLALSGPSTIEGSAELLGRVQEGAERAPEYVVTRASADQPTTGTALDQGNRPEGQERHHVEDGAIDGGEVAHPFSGDREIEHDSKEVDPERHHRHHRSDRF